MKKQICFAIGAYESNAWKSGNPHSGVFVTDVAKTLDALQGGNPACNQGGIAIVEIHYPGTSPERFTDRDQ